MGGERQRVRGWRVRREKKGIEDEGVRWRVRG